MGVCVAMGSLQTSNNDINKDIKEEHEEGFKFGLGIGFTYECATTIKGEAFLNDGNLWLALSFSPIRKMQSKRWPILG